MYASLTLRRFFCLKATAAAKATASLASSKKKPLVFLGSPEVLSLLARLHFSSIVNVELLVLFCSWKWDCYFSETCNIIFQVFQIVSFSGSVNIHPSLLSLYRGAAPVQRALQDGAKETGVSLAFTVRALDAGPVIACERVKVDDQIKAPELLALLFSAVEENVASEHQEKEIYSSVDKIVLLISKLASILDGSAKIKAQPQDESKVTLAPKVRAFAGWPGTRAKVLLVDDKASQQTTEVKVISTRVCNGGITRDNDVDEITFSNGALVIPCGRSTALEILELQLPGKKVVSGASFWNGLRGQKLKKLLQKIPFIQLAM
ncbi:hypothetical protein Tsubulata_027865 [Turnera subulata]|uniref:Methionyl-tRNA formyltransferase n=1 Tax=Turnera subulata TaxID=218843 RepID=A0A9Q0FFG4_9ROSI|nr:hypothetical protein Tsubulata_027865 [Turnera subulata]